MKQQSGHTKSVWLEEGSIPVSRGAMAEWVDVCVIGGGMAGLSVAYHLVKQKIGVLVLDDGPLGGGETCRTTAHLASAIDDRFAEVERIRGLEACQLAYQSHNAAIDRIEQIVRLENIECGLARLDGYLVLDDHGDVDSLAEEYDAARRAGFYDVEWLDKTPIGLLLQRPCIKFPNQGRFNPIQYLNGLARAILFGGGTLKTNAHVRAIHGDQDMAEIELSNGGRIKAKSVVVATNSPIVGISIHLRQFPYRSYVVGLDVAPNGFPDVLLWDTADPYHYVRRERGHNGMDVLLVGGEDHKTGLADDSGQRFAHLEAWARAHFQGVGNLKYHWSGQVMETLDGLGLIGKAPDRDNLYIVTGDSGMGMTHSTIAGMLITDLILNRQNDWEELYDPDRVPVKGLPSILRENLEAIPQLAKRLTPGDISSKDELAPGHAAVLRDGFKKIAVYRDMKGHFHEVSAVCTHLGCVVEWNSGERTWDCPCHGSRFSVNGDVINGPAAEPLQNVHAKEFTQSHK
jgi:glycine/D-amino acid oxidase-like deaminating enzyme/nitrite reductase/ring-hydroxylating ferredoxin subunit